MSPAELLASFCASIVKSSTIPCNASTLSFNRSKQIVFNFFFNVIITSLKFLSLRNRKKIHVLLFVTTKVSY
ncbi:hypothetical protein MODO_3281 [Myroides odoratimimus]|nr:hypothetical protein MODO_3281 [Myroides odoratimimus]